MNRLHTPAFGPFIADHSQLGGLSPLDIAPILALFDKAAKAAKSLSKQNSAWKERGFAL